MDMILLKNAEFNVGLIVLKHKAQIPLLKRV